MLAWVDIETTGLDPEMGSILEVGIIITGDRCEEIARESWIVRPLNAHHLITMPEEAARMHTRSGLMTDCLEGLSLNRAERDIRSWLALYAAGKGGPMCGSSVHFDRAWLRHHMPSVFSWWGYRNIDISSVKELTKRWAPQFTTGSYKEKKGHRVLSDLEYTIEEARHYMENIFV